MEKLTDQELRGMYWERGLSIREIARELGLHQWAVWKLMREFCMPRRPYRYVGLDKDDLYKLYWVEGLSAREIAESIGVSHKAILDRMNTYGVPRREYYAPYKVKVRVNSSEDLAYIFGVLDGDGWLRLDRGHYFIHLHVKDRDFAEEFAGRLSRILGRPVAVWHGGDDFYDARHYVPKCLISLFQAYPTMTENWTVPDFIMQGNRKLVANYLRGFADSEGSLNEVSRAILLCNTNREGLKHVMRLLRDKIGLKYGKVSLVSKGLAIYGRRNLQIFSEVVGFSIRKKQEKLLHVLRSYAPSRKSKKVCWNKKVLKELYLKGLSTVDIAREFGISPTTVSYWMKKFGIPRRSLREHHHLRRRRRYD